MAALALLLNFADSNAPIVALLVQCAIFTVMFALGLGFKPSSCCPAQHPGVMTEFLVGTACWCPWQGLLRSGAPLTADLSSRPGFAIALDGDLPSAPLALNRESRAFPELAACIRFRGVRRSFGPLMVGCVTGSIRLNGWDSHRCRWRCGHEGAVVSAGGRLVAQAGKPAWGERWSGVINQWPRLVVVLWSSAAGVTSSSLFPLSGRNCAWWRWL